MQVYDAKPGDPGEDVRLVVLIDGASASAAEIVAAALQDAGRAVVVGTNSYGKGTVQTVIRTPNDGELTLTWSRFHSPSGYALHGLGVLPTICTADDHAQAVALLAPVREGGGSVASTIAAWRTVSPDAAEERKHLRAICPPAKRANAAIDLEVARDLIGDRDLLAHALSLTAPVTTASSTALAGPLSQH